MQQPKYKAWDKVEEQMREVLDLSFHTASALCDYKEDAIGNADAMARQPLVNLVLLRSTGLTDKNNVEMYAGDIIQMVRLKDNKNYFTGTITDRGYLGMSIESEADYMDLNAPGYSYEIIGNIYEQTTKK